MRLAVVLGAARRVKKKSIKKSIFEKHNSNFLAFVTPRGPYEFSQKKSANSVQQLGQLIVNLCTYKYIKTS